MAHLTPALPGPAQNRKELLHVSKQVEAEVPVLRLTVRHQLWKHIRC